MRPIGLLALVALVAGAWTTTAFAQETYSLTGNIRTQIGDGLPIPIRLSAVPDGGINVDGVVTQTTALNLDNPKMIIKPGQYANPKLPLNAPVWQSNNSVMQVSTSLVFTGPASTATLEISGRSGADTVAFCPGDAVTAVGDPNCLNPTNGGTGGNLIPGLIRYTKTPARFKFGGIVASNIIGGGKSVIVLNKGAVAAAACPNCQASFQQVTPTQGAGGAWGNTIMSAPAPVVPGVYTVNVTASGKINSVGAVVTTGGSAMNPVAAGTNAAQSYGGPATTGMVTVSQPSTFDAGGTGTGEQFVITGSDMRVAGIGTISLVGGGVSTRTTTSGNANRGWFNLVVAPETPSMSGPGIVSLVGLLGVGGGYAMMRRRVRK
jgi:hypothetical protein